MNETKKKLEVVVCMGSSCFARGNDVNLEFLEELQKKGEIELELDIAGSRCDNKCECGPNVVVNGQLYSGVTQEKLMNILNESALN